MQSSGTVAEMVYFPEIIEGRIMTIEFLAAAREVVRTVDKLGRLFAPVRHDMQGNIDKLTARYTIDKENNATLQDMILSERAEKTNVATDALMWLTRGLHMILLFFEKIIDDQKTGAPSEDLVAFLRQAYKLALEPHHGWMAQQLFGLLSRMVPTRSQLLQTLADGQSNREEETLRQMELFLVNLRENVFTIQTFYKTHDLENTVVD